MATGLPDNIEDQVALVGGHGTAAARWARCALSRRAKFAVSGLLSLVVAVALALTIYFVTRPPRAAAAPNAYAASCTVFCHGDLLATVQAAQIWNDSKTFVDMPLTADPEDVLSAFHAQFPDPATATQEQLAAFVSNFFLTAGSDTEPWVRYLATSSAVETGRYRAVPTLALYLNLLHRRKCCWPSLLFSSTLPLHPRFPFPPPLFPISPLFPSAYVRRCRWTTRRCRRS